MKELSIPDHGQAIDEMFATMQAQVLDSLDEPPMVAHRLVHRGRYRESMQVDDKVLSEIRRRTPLFPLHHPAMVKEIEECLACMPHIVHVAVFNMGKESVDEAQNRIHGPGHHGDAYGC